MDLHNGLDIEVYDLRPTDLHYYYYYYYSVSSATRVASARTDDEVYRWQPDGNCSRRAGGGGGGTNSSGYKRLSRHWGGEGAPAARRAICQTTAQFLPSAVYTVMSVGGG